MKLATLKRGGRDGTLALVTPDCSGLLPEPAGIKTFQAALDDWRREGPRLEEAYDRLTASGGASERLAVQKLHSPLPRAYQWCEGSTYLPHMERMRAARGMTLPPEHTEEPIAYQSGADANLAPTDAIPLPDESWGLDLEATLAIVTDDVPVGTTAGDARSHILFVMLTNDLTYRHLMPREYAKGVGPYIAKPPRAYAPFAVNISSLGDSWDGCALHATVKSWVNGGLLGELDSGRDFAFDFCTMIAYLTQTRPLAAGTIVGTGTVANRDPAAGFGCLGEKRAVETTSLGAPVTPLLKRGDTVRIEAFDSAGSSLFGAIAQTVTDVERCM